MTALKVWYDVRMSHVALCTTRALVVFFVCMPLFANAEGASGQCDSQYNSCLSQKKSGCEQQWQGCMSKCNVGGGAVGSCNKDPECQLHCTESATSQGGRISCCEAGPKHQNSCPNKVDGNCEPKKTEGGEGKMPELPKPPQGGGGESQPSQEDCAQSATSTHLVQGTSSTTVDSEQKPCPPQQSSLGGYFNNIFSTDNNDGGIVGSVQSTFSSAADKLSSFLFGTESGSNSIVDNSGNQDSGGARSPVVPTGGTGLVPQVVQAQPIVLPPDANTPGVQVTGFGSTDTIPAEQSGIIRAISETLGGIRITLRNLFSSFAF